MTYATVKSATMIAGCLKAVSLLPASAVYRRKVRTPTSRKIAKGLKSTIQCLRVRNNSLSSGLNFVRIKPFLILSPNRICDSLNVLLLYKAVIPRIEAVLMAASHKDIAFRNLSVIHKLLQLLSLQ